MAQNFIPNGNLPSLQMQAVMFQKNTAISKLLWYVKFPNMQKPLMQQ
jgi:hypothetical protein